MVSEKDREKALDLALAQIERSFGKGSIMRLGEASARVAALVPRAELEGDMGDAHVGLQARLMSQALRKLTGAISRSKTSVIFINQLREKVGIVFGNPETTTGGKALK